MRYAVENGIIDVGTVIDAINMKKKEEILEKHNYKVYKGNDNYWHTYVKKEGEKRREIRKKSKDKLLDYLIDYYGEDTSSAFTFKNRFDDWKKRQILCGRCDNTISKYESDYKRLFSGRPFEDMIITDIQDSDIMQHFMSIAPEIPWRAAQSGFGYVKGIFDKAIRDRIIEEQFNPCKFVDFEIIKYKCKKTEKKSSMQRVLSDYEMNVLMDKLEKPRAHNYNYIVDRAVELSLYTGMRVGELCGLKWEDIKYEKGYILICRSEKYNRNTKEYFISDTKNHKVRTFPLTEEIIDIFDKVRKYQIEHDCLCDFVFSDSKGKIHTHKVSDSARNKTMSSEFTCSKGIHSIRRTFNSNLKRNGVSTSVAASILGHTERVNDNNYTYDTSTMLEKYEIVKKATNNLIIL